MNIKPYDILYLFASPFSLLVLSIMVMFESLRYRIPDDVNVYHINDMGILLFMLWNIIMWLLFKDTRIYNNKYICYLILFIIGIWIYNQNWELNVVGFLLLPFSLISSLIALIVTLG